MWMPLKMQKRVANGTQRFNIQKLSTVFILIAAHAPVSAPIIF